MLVLADASEPPWTASSSSSVSNAAYVAVASPSPCSARRAGACSSVTISTSSGLVTRARKLVAVCARISRTRKRCATAGPPGETSPRGPSTAASKPSALLWKPWGVTTSRGPVSRVGGIKQRPPSHLHLLGWQAPWPPQTRTCPTCAVLPSGTLAEPGRGCTRSWACQATRQLPSLRTGQPRWRWPSSWRQTAAGWGPWAMPRRSWCTSPAGQGRRAPRGSRSCALLSCRGPWPRWRSISWTHRRLRRARNGSRSAVAEAGGSCKLGRTRRCTTRWRRACHLPTWCSCPTRAWLWAQPGTPPWSGSMPSLAVFCASPPTFVPRPRGVLWLLHCAVVRVLQRWRARWRALYCRRRPPCVRTQACCCARSARLSAQGAATTCCRRTLTCSSYLSSPAPLQCDWSAATGRLTSSKGDLGSRPTGCS